MRLCFLALISGWIGGGLFVNTAQASPYQKALATCKSRYQEGIKDCREVYRESRPRCVNNRKEALIRCKQLRESSVCQRKSPTAEQRGVCKQVEVMAKARCHKTNTESRSCTAALNLCRQGCFRNCKICTIRNVLPCVTQCKTVYRSCLGDDKDARLKCERKAQHLGRICQRKQTYQVYREHYRCLYRQMKNHLDCQHQAYDSERECYYAASDNQRHCFQRQNSLWTECRARAGVSSPK